MGDTDNNSNGLVAFFQRVWAGIVGLFGVVSAILGYIKLADGDFGLFTLVLLGVGVAGLFLSCLYYAFFWKPELGDGKSGDDKSTESIIITSGSNRPKVPQREKEQKQKEKHRKRVRWLARLGLLLVPVLVWGGYRFYQHQLSLPPKDFKILVANFEGSDAGNHRVTQEIFRNLERELERYGDDVKVERLDKSLKSIRAAKAAGKQKKAEIVIWGDYQVLKDVVPISVNFEILKETANFLELGELVQGKTQLVPISQLNSFELQTNLSQEMTYLSLFTLGMYRYLDEDWKQAQVFHNKALRTLKATNEPIISLGREVVYLYLGNSSSFQKIYDKALNNYNKAIELKPDYADAHNSRGNIYYVLGKYEKALNNYNKAIELKPDLGKAYLNRGSIHYVREEYEKSLNNYNKAIELKPDYADAYYGRGISHGNLGEYEKSLSDFNKAIKLKPEYADTYFNRGISHKKQGNKKAAIEDFTQASELYKKQGNSESYQNSLDRLKELEN